MKNENEITLGKIDFKAKIKPIKPLNPEFDLVKIYIQGVGKNRNMTYMSKDRIIEYSKATLPYCPVVGHIIKGINKDTGEELLYVGSHDGTMDWDTWTWVDLTVPYGVVCDGNKEDYPFEFEMVDEYGTEVEYLTAYAILWTGRYLDLKKCIYSDDIWFNESMEININQFKKYEEDSNYTELLDWSYSALCLLGKADDESTTGHTDPEQHSEPCFISSHVEPVKFSQSEFTSLMKEMKEKIAFALKNQHSSETSTAEEFDIENNNGGTTTMSKEEKDTEIVEPVTETESVEEVKNEDTPTENVVADETIDNNVSDENSNIELSETSDAPAENHSVEETPEEQVTSKDESEETEEVEATDTATESDEKDSEDYSAKYSELKAEYETLEKEFSDYKAEHSFLDSEVNELKEYKQNKETEERKNAEEAVFAKYEGIIGETSEYALLKDSASDYSIEALEKECVYIVGKYAMTKSSETKSETVTEKEMTESLKFSLENKEPVEEDPYGGLMKKYKKNGGK